MALTTPHHSNTLSNANRRQVMILHTLVAIALGYQLLYSQGTVLTEDGQLWMLLALFASILGLALLPTRWWNGGWLPGILVLGDTAATSVIIFVSGNASSDLYLTFFLILLIAAFAPTIQQTIAYTLVLCAAYGIVLALQAQGGNPLDESHLLGIPVLLVLAIFYGVLAETVRTLRREKTDLMEHISERKKLEEQLRMAQKMEAVGRLAGGVAHDFNNVLTIIMGYSERLLRKLAPEDPLRGNVEEIQKAGQRASSLTQQLLAFSRRQVLEPEVLNLNEVVENTSQMLRPTIGEDIEMRTILHEHLGSVEVDRSKIEQVIMNLAINARDAMPHGGKLLIETANMVLDEACLKGQVTLPPGPYVMLAVSDTGHGMTPDIQDRIFEPFFTTKAAGKGTGLGLATVYGIMKQSNGFVFCYSEPGMGTTFKLYLPQVDRAPEFLDGTVGDLDLPFGSETVLLVEDEEQVRDLVSDTLEQYGYTVLVAEDPYHALRLNAQHKEPIHLLVTDVVMPGMSGKEVADRVGETRPAVRVLYMSGYTEDAIVHHGVLEPGVMLLPKPFPSETLVRKVRDVLDMPEERRRKVPVGSG